MTPPIRFRTTVGLVEPDGAGYTVTLDGGRARHFSHVVVASGLRRERPGRVDGCAGGAGVPSRCGGDRVADFPFLPSDAAPLMVGPMRLFRRIVMPGHERMFFVGFVRPRGAWAPVVLAQARWVAEVVVGGITLPGRSRMADALITDERALGHRLRHVPHPTVEIDDHRYRRQLQRDRDRARRPAATRQAPPRTAAAAPAPTRC
ncbi:hypothetical protein [Streptomyces sp. NPDC050560]|uniref:hypothetical protein n=1 Tax=Streptomyces sp. NPDC050560 TaxID=3365630 RepID=UPI0037A95767